MRKWVLVPLVVGSCAKVALNADPGADGSLDLALLGPPDLVRRAPPDLARSVADLATATADLATAPFDLAAPSPSPDLALAQGGGCGVEINEVQTAGGGGANDEFVELYNPCGSAIDLAGYRLVYRSAAGVSDVTMLVFPKLPFPAGGFLVCGQNAYPGTADARYAISMASPGGGVGLRDAKGALVDSVGWGTATNAFVEGAAAKAPASASSIARIPDGRDSDDNSKDLAETNPTPRKPNH